MTRLAPESGSDIPPAAREFVAALTAAPVEPVRMLVSGGMGTGKSSVLSEVRGRLRAAGIAVLARAPRPGDPAESAIVVDNAHLLDDDEIGQLTELVADHAATVVVAAEPLAHRTALRTLVTTLERENPAIELRSLTPAEMGQAVSAAFGGAPPPDAVRILTAATEGLPFLLRPAIAALSASDGDPSAAAITQVAGFALIDRLRRLDERLLDTLLVSSLSPELGADDVAAALQIGASAALAVVDRARASGLIEPSHSEQFQKLLHGCIAQVAGAAHYRRTLLALLSSQLEISTLSVDVGLRMAELGLRSDRLATALVDLAAGALSQPARGAQLYRAAANALAGGPPGALNARLADALALLGDCPTAGRLSDELLGSEDPGDRAAAVRIAASIALHDGNAAQAADLFRWLRPYPEPVVSTAGAIVALAAGDAAAAKAALRAESLLASLDQPYSVAMARLSHSITFLHGPSGVAPDTPAAVVTLAALHGGDPLRAHSVIGRAVRTGADRDGGDAEIFSAHRHRLLLGWVQMLDGQLQAANAAANLADPDRDGAALHRRDALWAAALRTGIARRSGDAGALHRHWYAGMEILAEYSIDLFSLLPLGELWVSAARMHQVDRLQPDLTEAFALLEGLGNPVLWSAPLHWAGVHAGILANAPEAVAPHGQALTAASRDHRADSAFAKALANAGRTWLRVLANHVDGDDVAVAARAMARFGLTWDATRLAGQAALHTDDPRVSGVMLQVARDLKQVADDRHHADAMAGDRPAGAAPQAATVSASATAVRAVAPRLSDREREVAELLVLGMPYRDIGSQLFISAKTVEHHVARIRRRLGAQSRSEMLSMLRAMLSPSGEAITDPGT
ncbi:MAG: isoniazid response ATPase/transcriptional regulator IniR [Mycobacterium sp.]